jgi:predicted esterase
MSNNITQCNEDEFKIECVEAGKGFNYGYWYWIPKSFQDAPKKYILVVPNNKKDDACDKKEWHIEKAKGNMGDCVREVGCVALVPVFPKPEWIYIHSLNRNTMLLGNLLSPSYRFENECKPMERLDKQLIEMIEDLKKKLSSDGINLEKKILMDGYSASGQFVNRFTAMHPELVQAAVAGGVSGMPILPADTLDGERLIYSVGIADLQEITGKPFDLEQYKEVHQFIYMGANDDYDTFSQSFCLSIEEKELIQKVLLDGKPIADKRDKDKFISDIHKMWEKSIQVYRDQGCPDSVVKFKKYDGLNHCEAAGSDEIKGDIIDFFKEHIK